MMLIHCGHMNQADTKENTLDAKETFIIMDFISVICDLLFFLFVNCARDPPCTTLM